MKKIKDLTSGKTSNAHRSKDLILVRWQYSPNTESKKSLSKSQLDFFFFFSEIDKTMIFAEVDNRQKFIWIFETQDIHKKKTLKNKNNVGRLKLHNV